jgi:hypothetical protein
VTNHHSYLTTSKRVNIINPVEEDEEEEKEDEEENSESASKIPTKVEAYHQLESVYKRLKK